MRRNPAAMADRTFDLLVIGGGILGAGIARDAAMRGLSVALVDKADFASGTSSNSSKLIHGGFRYLEQRAFRLVAEALRERKTLTRLAPHLVKPVPFILPVYEGDPRSLKLMRLGMTLYDLLARSPRDMRHRLLRDDGALDEEPGLNPGGLHGAIRYFDCQEDDARLCLENLIHAGDLGARCANYCEVTSLSYGGGRIAAANVVDRLTESRFEVRAKVFVNAAGPWVDRVCGFGPPEGRVALSPTKGVHVLLPKLTRGHAITFQAKQDGRVMFVIPWHDCSLVGTTDTDFSGDPADARAEPADVAYILREVRRLFPDSQVDESHVITTFAGVRALLKSDASAPSARPREHKIARQGENMLSIAGGKYTTYRAIAETAVDEVYRLLGSRPARCRTDRTPFPEHRPAPRGERLSDVPEVFESDVQHACATEMAVSVTDVMRRRTPLALSRYGGPEVAGRVARLMAPLLGWDEGRTRESLEEYVREWERNRPASSNPVRSAVRSASPAA
jgi:glycerol-3-phosphate dehydrogenase